MADYIAAIDQGTTSTRCLIFDRSRPVAVAQLEHKQRFPRPGWVEHDPAEIWGNTVEVIRQAIAKAGVRPGQIAALGIANQRETTVPWDRRSGRAVAPAIVWQDTRTDELCRRLAGGEGQDRFRQRVGLPLATYFSGPKIRWLLDSDPAIRHEAERGNILFGTIDSWLIWNLTGGPQGGVHVTDVTNASRTMLMNLRTLEWDAEMLEAMEVPKAVLPRIVPSIDPAGWGTTRRDGPFGEAIRVCGCLGDQQAALVGQTCFAAGDLKNTYGTGCFMLLNTGDTPVMSSHGLITTVACQVAGQKATYALEGSVAVAGALVQWMRDNFGLLQSSSDIETVARSVTDNGGVYIVPAFSGLFAPYWRTDARGVIAGLTAYANRGHLARAVLEATAFQTYDVLQAMRRDAAMPINDLRVDGGMSVNGLLMQFQADLLGLPVVRPSVVETTSLGAAYAAGLAVGYYRDLDDLRSAWQVEQRWEPQMDDARRDRLLSDWHRAVDRSLDWAVAGPKQSV